MRQISAWWHALDFDWLRDQGRDLGYQLHHHFIADTDPGVRFLSWVCVLSVLGLIVLVGVSITRMVS